MAWVWKLSRLNLDTRHAWMYVARKQENHRWCDDECCWWWNPFLVGDQASASSRHIDIMATHSRSISRAYVGSGLFGVGIGAYTLNTHTARSAATAQTCGSSFRARLFLRREDKRWDSKFPRILHALFHYSVTTTAADGMPKRHLPPQLYVRRCRHGMAWRCRGTRRMPWTFKSIRVYLNVGGTWSFKSMAYILMRWVTSTDG